MVATLHFGRNSLNGIVYISDSLIYPVKILIKNFEFRKSSDLNLNQYHFMNIMKRLIFKRLQGPLLKSLSLNSLLLEFPLNHWFFKMNPIMIQGESFSAMLSINYPDV